ncbi:MarR family transcriptional regulator [Streptomyces sp. LZ34]
MDQQRDDSGLAEELIACVLDSCGPAKPAAPASGLGVNPSTAMRTVDRLESLGLVDRRGNPDSRRSGHGAPQPHHADLVIARRYAEIRDTRRVAGPPRVHRAARTAVANRAANR